MNNGKLVLVRHGLSVYNDQNRFTGWKDVELNQQGNEEAVQAGSILKDYNFDLAFTSNLVRAQNTLEIIFGYYQVYCASSACNFFQRPLHYLFLVTVYYVVC